MPACQFAWCLYVLKEAENLELIYDLHRIISEVPIVKSVVLQP